MDVNLDDILRYLDEEAPIDDIIEHAADVALAA